jgi:hypothetical protein
MLFSPLRNSESGSEGKIHTSKCAQCTRSFLLDFATVQCLLKCLDQYNGNMSRGMMDSTTLRSKHGVPKEDHEMVQGAGYERALGKS